ncbi:MAG: hypothetical protein H7X97_12705 [Opitutaceae bacterium]|nr:hypothetical protein [Verrucomicrobiales bacterium]
MRILIATVTAGGGHLAAASALEEAWRAMRPSDVLEKVDVLDYVPKLHKKIYAEGYVKLIERAPELYAMVFNKTDNPSLMRKLTRWRRTFAEKTNRKFVKHLREFRPEVVLCTHFLPPEILGALKTKLTEFQPQVVSVITDFEAHALWMEPSVNLYCVATEETRARLIARGGSAEDIVVTGIPIGARFNQPVDAAAVRKQHGLRDDLPTLLVLGGGFGMGPVAEILDQLDQIDSAFQTVVVAGRNEELRRDLAVQDHRHPTHILGFTRNMHELMTVADLIVSKPGGLTTSEALALGRPLFILNPIPGQEAANSDFLLERGAATKVNRVEDLPFRIKQLLGSGKLKEIARAAKALGRPNAAADICREVVRRFAPVTRD